MIPLQRRILLAAGATVASALVARKLLAAAEPEPQRFGVVHASAGALPPDLRFTLPDGTVRTIADYAGHGIVLNLWATWCVPCVAEMPALDTLAGAVQRAGVVVLPLSSDRGGAAAVQRFYGEHGVKHLPVILDPSGAAARLLAVRGIPTTLLIDTKGVERGRLEGGADWDSAATIEMVKKLATTS